MATKDKILSNYPSVTDAAEGSLLYLVIPNVSSATGYTAKKITATDLAKSILNDYTFTNLLDTTAKNVFGAINELASGTYDVSDLGDVELTSLTGGQILMYDSASSKWVNYSLDTSVSADEVSYNNSASGLQATDLQNAVDEVASSLGSTSLAGLNDVNITSATADQVLKYDATNSKWVNGNSSNSVSSLTDTTISNPANGQVLTYDSNSSKWVNANSSSNVEYFDIAIAYDHTNLRYTISSDPLDVAAAYFSGKKFRIIIADSYLRGCNLGDKTADDSDFIPIEDVTVTKTVWDEDPLDMALDFSFSSVRPFRNDMQESAKSAWNIYFRAGHFVLYYWYDDQKEEYIGDWNEYDEPGSNAVIYFGSMSSSTEERFSQTLTAGSTYVTFPPSNYATNYFSDDYLNAYTFDIYTKDLNCYPTDIQYEIVSSGKSRLKIYFDQQSADVTVTLVARRSNSNGSYWPTR